MLDPRLYRACMALVAVAVIVFGFSLKDQPGPAGTTVAPAVPGGTTAWATLTSLKQRYPDRKPGSPGDLALANAVATAFTGDKSFTVGSETFSAETADGPRTLRLVTASRTGVTPGTIVVVAHRDSELVPGMADLSGTAVLLGLAHELAGETVSHSLLLVSTSGSVGAAGATELAGRLAGQPIDAVIVLGDLVRAHPSEPIVSPWSNSETVTPPLLRRTLATYVSGQTGLSTGSTTIGGQLAHLAFPLTSTEQGPFGGEGIPAVLLSLSGVRGPKGGEAVSAAHIDQLQSAVLEAVNALDAGPEVPAPAAYMLLNGETVPVWAVRLLVLALIVPVLVVTVDALARARRRGHTIVRWLAWVLAGAVPFLLALPALRVTGVIGVLPATPPGPVAGGVALTFAGGAVMAVVAILMLVAFFALRPLCIRAAADLGAGSGRRPETPAGDGAAVGLMIVTLFATLVLWVLNPFAAALVIPALHLWLWLAHPGVRSHRTRTLALSLIGLLPAVLVAAYYAHTFGLSPVGLAFTGVLLVAGGQLSLVAAILWCVLLGCTASALVISIRSGGAPVAAPAPVTVRGPVSYAGPGSLGGTESALGQRR